ncbi:MAG: hypothetical protein P8L99_04065 [Hyphomicrobiales bacterium]|nr:hypothetical protein [Hyphomicrobiales bacterium]
MSEDINKKFYLRAEKEFNSDIRDEALWAKSLYINQGNEDKAKYKYIELRVQELNKKVKRKDKEEKNIFEYILGVQYNEIPIYALIWFLIGWIAFLVWQYKL